MWTKIYLLGHRKSHISLPSRIWIKVTRARGSFSFFIISDHYFGLTENEQYGDLILMKGIIIYRNSYTCVFSHLNKLFIGINFLNYLLLVYLNVILHKNTAPKKSISISKGRETKQNKVRFCLVFKILDHEYYSVHLKYPFIGFKLIINSNGD